MPTLEEVNQNLLERLDEVIQEAGAEDLLAITAAVAKLNASVKGNDKIGIPVSEEDKRRARQLDVLSDALMGEVVDK